jgi:hypothetical protein
MDFKNNTERQLSGAFLTLAQNMMMACEKNGIDFETAEQALIDSMVRTLSVIIVSPDESNSLPEFKQTILDGRIEYIKEKLVAETEIAKDVLKKEGYDAK